MPGALGVTFLLGALFFNILVIINILHFIDIFPFSPLYISSLCIFVVDRIMSPVKVVMLRP